eukprot:CAMPEP_0114490442 /NCGR_PEP_ID=MMETSP0109-20121206/2447_1 /TAXON_ID=29199 /ORGANISM="Chlorarachnion reptans, Strain CCCM449" /LENGTH=154 /DNA_ID=CAMNT_0001667065 /DNA_START=59 /DNA_END=523 /DNA_ORIENTATION=-
MSSRRQNALHKSIQIRRRLMVYDVLDRQKAATPDCKSPFKGYQDAFERLSPFQAFDVDLPTEKQAEDFNVKMDKMTLDLLHKMRDVETALNSHLVEDEKNPRYEELVALEKMAVKFSNSEAKRLYEERARLIDPEFLLCHVHGLDPNIVLKNKR